MSAFWAVIIAFIAGEALGIIVTAVLGGQLDRWLDRREKKKGR